MKLCGFDVGLDQRFFLIAGTCSIEGLEMSIEVAGQLKEACTALGIPLIYKGSFDKANRSSGTSKRGVGLDAGLMTNYMSLKSRAWWMFCKLPPSCAARQTLSVRSPSAASR
jgi:3-deoxy-D-manno-octulosonic acid (KDO) 8-phosphate synthase